MPHALSLAQFDLWMACDGRTSLTQLSQTQRLGMNELGLELARLRGLDLLWPDRMPALRPELTAVRVGEETLVYHPDQKVVFHLGPAESLVLAHCDGQTNPDELVGQLDHQDPEGLLDITLSDFSERGLLARPVPRRTSRGEFIARWGKAAAALPVIASLATPSPAARPLASLVAAPAAPLQTAAREPRPLFAHPLG